MIPTEDLILNAREQLGRRHHFYLPKAPIAFAMNNFPSDQPSMLQGYSGSTIPQATSLSALNLSSSGSSVPRGTTGSISTPFSSQEYPTNETIASDLLMFDFDDDFLPSGDIQGFPPATTSDYGTVTQHLQSQPQPQLQYLMLLPAQARAQDPFHPSLYQEQQIQLLASLEPSTSYQSLHFVTSPMFPLQQQQQLQWQQASLPYENNFVGRIDLTSSHYYGVTFEQPTLEGVSPSSDQGYLDVAGEESPFTTSSGSPLSNPFAGLEHPNMAQTLSMSIDSSRMNLAGQGVLMSAPMDSSTLKQQQDPGCISDDSDLVETFDLHANATRKKRVRKPSKSKAPPQILPCHYPNCDIICSSFPSLSRHYETHKWRGQYSPVRCEGCEGSYSNKYSVQRHILRPPQTSLCHKMKIYSIMKSETDIDSTVRFYPNGLHGKKTAKVDLEKMRVKYFNNS